VEDLLRSLIDCVRGRAEVLEEADNIELESGSALDEEADRMAFRQVVTASSLLENSLPRHRVRPLPRRQEVPTRVLDEDAYPVGGFSSLSNRGSIESLLHSQLAYIDDGADEPDLFDIKYLRDELLFYSRDENQFLRRRRTFVVAFYPDLARAIRFKDAELSYQRGILLLGLLHVVVRKLSEWLSTDALVFELVFVVPEGDPLVFPLDTEFDLLARLFREQATNGSVVFDVLFLAGKDASQSESQQAELEEMRRDLRSRLPRGPIRFETVPSLEAIEVLCSQRARRSLCHCLALSASPQKLEPLDTVVTHCTIDGPAPLLGGTYEKPTLPEGEDAFEQWCSALREVLARWI
jgi:vWA domain found in the FtsH ternary systems